MNEIKYDFFYDPWKLKFQFCFVKENHILRNIWWWLSYMQSDDEIWIFCIFWPRFDPTRESYKTLHKTFETNESEMTACTIIHNTLYFVYVLSFHAWNETVQFQTGLNVNS